MGIKNNLLDKLKLQRLDKTERILLIAFFVLFALDIFSTIMFIVKGYANLEANIIIWKFGWLTGSVIVFLLNLALIYFFIYKLQKSRDFYKERFYVLSSVVVLCVLRGLAVVNNVIAAVTLVAVETHTVQKLTPSELAPFAITILVIFSMFIIVNIVSFIIFTKNYEIKYKK